MGRPRKEIQTPGQENQRPEENATDALLLNSVVQQPSNTPEQLNAATAGATVITVQEPQSSEEAFALAARNALLGAINEQEPPSSRSLKRTLSSTKRPPAYK